MSGQVPAIAWPALDPRFRAMPHPQETPLIQAVNEAGDRLQALHAAVLAWRVTAPNEAAAMAVAVAAVERRACLRWR